jgi:hypothetical protein
MAFMIDVQTETESTLAYITDTYVDTTTQEESNNGDSSDTDSSSDSDSTDYLM